jgi:hypothetical protein
MCWMCPLFQCRVTLGPSRLPLGAAPLAADLARVSLLHHYVEVCKLVGPRHGHVPKVGLLCRVGEASRPAAGGLPRLPSAVPPSDVHRGDLECHACFNKLVLELVEVRVRGTERLGIDHQQLVIRVVLEFFGHGLRLDAGARLNRRRQCCCLGLFP